MIIKSVIADVRTAGGTLARRAARPKAAPGPSITDPGAVTVTRGASPPRRPGAGGPGRSDDGLGGGRAPSLTAAGTVPRNVGVARAAVTRGQATDSPQSDPAELP